MENLYENFNINEAFKRLSLLEDDFDFSSPDIGKIDELRSFVADDIDEIQEEPIIDVEAKDENDLADNYIGKVVLECTCCHSRMYKNEEDVIVDQETGYANMEDACPVCNNELGYTVIGKIEPFDKDRDIEAEAEEAEPVEETPVEEVEETEEKEVTEESLEETDKDTTDEPIKEELSEDDLPGDDEVDESCKLEGKCCEDDDLPDPVEEEYPGDDLKEEPVVQKPTHSVDDRIKRKHLQVVKESYELVDKKYVSDADGFATEYAWYKDEDGHHVFVFGDTDLYRPEDGNFDWECDSREEAQEWFDNYEGFDDEVNEDMPLEEADERINLKRYGFVRAPEEDFTDDGARFFCYYYDPEHKGDKRIRLSKTTYNGDAYLSARYENSNGRYKYFDDLNGVSIANAINGLPALTKQLNDFLANIDEFDRVEHLDDEQLAGLSDFAVDLIDKADMDPYNARNKALTKAGYEPDAIAKDDIRTLDDLIRNHKSYDKEQLKQDVESFIKGVLKEMTSYSYGYGRNMGFHGAKDLTQALASQSYTLRRYPDAVQKRVYDHVYTKVNELYTFKDEALNEEAPKIDIKSLVAEIMSDLEASNLIEAFDEREKELYVGLNEDLTKVTAEADGKNIEVTSEEGKVNVSIDTEETTEETTVEDAEEIVPLTSEEEAEIEDNTAEEESTEEESTEEEVEETGFPTEDKEEEEEITEFQEESFNFLVKNYARKIYENVKSYRVKDVTCEGKTFTIDGQLLFKSGKVIPTTFILERKFNKKGKFFLEGKNETFSKSKNAYKFVGITTDGEYVFESMKYNYYTTNLDESANNQRVRVTGKVVR